MTERQSDKDERACQNTDREIWRERPGDYYADSIYVTESGGIGIDCGGYVYVMPVRKWHELAKQANAPLPELQQSEPAAWRHLTMHGYVVTKTKVNAECEPLYAAPVSTSGASTRTHVQRLLDAAATVYIAPEATEQEWEELRLAAEDVKLDLDGVPAAFSASGALDQPRYSAKEVIEWAKARGLPTTFPL